MTEGSDHSSTSPSGAQGEMFGPYRLEQRIGRGGMGEVFRAYDTVHQRTVAIKRLHGGLADDADYQERFRRESQTAADLNSPHIVPIHDFGTIDGRLYIDMRLVTGDDLAAEIERAGRLEPRRAAEIVRQTADALDAAHEKKLIHRDVKPSNVLITQHRGRDFVYLVDFGIVRAMGGDTKSSLTGTGTAIGTLAYMAPELFVGRQMDRRVDVYALGCLLFEAVAGRPPFLAEGPALMYDHLNEAPPRVSEVAPGTPPALDEVLATAMAKDPNQRYATAGDFADAAVQAVGGETPATDSVPGAGTDDATARTATQGSGSGGAAAGAAAAGGAAAGAAAAAGAGSSGRGQGAPPTYVPASGTAGGAGSSGPQGGTGSAPWSPQGGGSGPQQNPLSGPQYGGPSYGAPSYGAPSYGAPSYGAPGPYGSGVQNGAPPYGAPGPYASGQQNFSGGYPPGGGATAGRQYPPTAAGGPAGMSGPQGGWGPGGPGGPPPKSGAGKVVAIVAGIAVLLLVVVIGAVVLISRSSGPATPTAAPQTPATSPSAPTTAPSTSASVPPGQPALSQVFPDVASSNCGTANPPARTSSGIISIESYVCDFSSAAPGAQVIFARWADANGAQSSYQDIAAVGPRIENFEAWQTGGVEQGPLYTAQSNGTVYATGIYRGLNYSWEIRASNLDQYNAVFSRVQFRARSTFGG